MATTRAATARGAPFGALFYFPAYVQLAACAPRNLVSYEGSQQTKELMMQFKPIWKVEPRFFGVDDARAIIPQHYVIVYADTGDPAGMWTQKFSTAEEAQKLVDECHAEAATAPKYR